MQSSLAVITATCRWAKITDHNPRLTRAEPSEAANAIPDGSDAVMPPADLGKYPRRCVDDGRSEVKAWRRPPATNLRREKPPMRPASHSQRSAGNRGSVPRRRHHHVTTETGEARLRATASGC